MSKHYIELLTLLLFFTAYQVNGQCDLKIAASASKVCSGSDVILTADVKSANLPLPQNLLTTTFAGGNSRPGNYFDLVAINEVRIDSFDIHPTGNTTIEVYYRVGSYMGMTMDESQWSLIGSAPVIANNSNTPTPLKLPINVTIPAGSTYAFYITSSINTGNINYTNGTKAGNIYKSDANLKILEGNGATYPFGTPVGARIFNGNIYYSTSSNTYTWNTTSTDGAINETITSSQNYSVTVNTPGCPELKQSINIDIFSPTIDKTVTLTGSTLTATATNAAYQWVDCSTNTLISDATDQSYSFTKSGSYSVIVTDDNCMDTSNCVEAIVQNTLNPLDKSLFINPNPTEGQLNITSANIHLNIITVIDRHGKEVYSLNPESMNAVIDLQPYPSGLYFVKVKSGTYEKTYKISKQ